LSAYVNYAEEMESLDTSISNVYWVMFHKPPPDQPGGCKFDDLTWSKREREYDFITWETVQKKSRETVVEYDETCHLERDDDARDMLGAAGQFSERYNDAHEDRYGDVNMYLSDDE
jgi:hypothetical protein